MSSPAPPASASFFAVPTADSGSSIPPGPLAALVAVSLGEGSSVDAGAGAKRRLRKRMAGAACIACRKVKIRCDTTRPCQNCIRRGEECTSPVVRSTCSFCAKSKLKCDREQPCGRCVARGRADKCVVSSESRGALASHESLAAGGPPPPPDQRGASTSRDGSNGAYHAGYARPVGQMGEGGGMHSTLPPHAFPHQGFAAGLHGMLPMAQNGQLSQLQMGHLLSILGQPQKAAAHPGGKAAQAPPLPDKPYHGPSGGVRGSDGTQEGGGNASHRAGGALADGGHRPPPPPERPLPGPAEISAGPVVASDQAL